MPVWSNPPRKITFWEWICGSRITNTTPHDIIMAFEAKLISDRDARELMNIHGSDYERISDERTK